MIYVAAGICIDESELEERFVRASGPGGQHVNKTSSAVQIQFNVNANSSIYGPVRARLVRLAGKRMSPDGILSIECQSHRSQQRNRTEALDRLIELIRKATEKPKPRRATKPTRGSQKRRMDAKQRRGKVKALRRKANADD